MKVPDLLTFSEVCCIIFYRCADLKKSQSGSPSEAAKLVRRLSFCPSRCFRCLCLNLRQLHPDSIIPVRQDHCYCFKYSSCIWCIHAFSSLYLFSQNGQSSVSPNLSASSSVISSSLSQPPNIVAVVLPYGTESQQAFLQS